jgi:hypothetical protein
MERKSEVRRVAARFAGALTATALLTVVLPVMPSSSGHAFFGRQKAPRLDGEHGLYVAERGDTVEVRWLTSEPDSGFLKVRATAFDDHETGAGPDAAPDALEFTTAQARIHSAAFRRPGDAPFSLTYGAIGGEQGRHATTIWPTPERAKTKLGPVDSLFVVGDVHGEYDTLTAVLRNAGVIDSDGRWSGGRRHLVFLGDLFDRGDDVTRTLWFIYGLERQAESAGGRVHVVLGNHEIMVLTNDLRYVAVKERHIAQLHGVTYPQLFDVRHSVLGKWLASKPGVMRIGRILLAHGGVSTDYAAFSLDAFDDSLAGFMSEELFYRWGQPPDSTLPPIVIDSAAVERRIDFFYDENSVFWYRDYVMGDTLRAALDQVLTTYDSDVHVVAHTPVDRIGYRYDGALIAVDLSAPATQLLLLVQDEGSLRAFRYRSEGPPEALGPE